MELSLFVTLRQRCREVSADFCGELNIKSSTADTFDFTALFGALSQISVEPPHHAPKCIEPYHYSSLYRFVQWWVFMEQKKAVMPTT